MKFPHFRTLTCLTVAAALTVSLTGCSTSASTEAETPAELVPITVGFPWNGGPGATPTDTGAFGYAESLGLADPILEENGYRFDRHVGFNNGPPVIQALQSGDITVGSLGDVPSIQARGNGQEIRAISVRKPSNGIWFLTNDPGLDTIEELAGHKIGLQFGSNFDKYGRAALDRYGVSEKVELVNLIFADALPALQQGSISAVALPANVAAVWLEKNDFTIASKAEEDDPDLLATSLSVVTEDFLDQYPDFPEVYWKVEQAGIAEIEKDLDAYISWIAETQQVSPDSVRASSTWEFTDERINPDGVETLKKSQDFLFEQGIIREKFDIEEWVVR